MEADLQTAWWRLPDEQIADGVIAAQEQSRAREADRPTRLALWARLYAGRNALKVLPGYLFVGNYASPYGDIDDDRIRFNVNQSVIDTLTARVGKVKPKPTYITDSGDWYGKRAAQKLDVWTEGTYYQTHFYDKLPMMFRDAGVFGTGILHVYREHGRIQVERVIPGELFVDPADAAFGDPRSMYRIKRMDQWMLKDKFPQYQEAIEAAADTTQADQYSKTPNAEQVEVVEAWHLPSSPTAKDGKHVIAIKGQVLISEDWERDGYPFVFLQWSPGLAGFWGQGACERLKQIQIEINRILQRIQEGMALLANPTTYLEEGSKVVKGHLNNRVGNIVVYRGTQPMVITPQTVQPEMFNQLDRLINRAYIQEGVTEASAGGRVEPGLESGKAIRTRDDIETDRFSILSRQVETAAMDVAKLFIIEAREALANKEPLEGTVMSHRRRNAQKVSFKDIELADDQYVMQVFPTSSLSRTPAGRLEDVQDMMNAGLIDAVAGARLLDFPDLDYENEILFAPLDYIDWRVTEMLENDSYESPVPWQNLQLTTVRLQRVWQRESINGCPPDKLELLKMYMDEAAEMQMGAQAAMAPPAMTAGAPAMPALPAQAGAMAA